jgi:outer membrane protein TolC
MNLKTVCVLVAACLAAPSMVAETQELENATLKDLVLQAIETHEVVQIANSEIRRAQADVGLAKSALMPRLELNGSYTFYNDDLSVELSPGESFVIRPRQDFTASIDLRQNLFTGLRA